MADKPQKILVEKDLRPAYYDDFHCLAAGCRISCCKGWNITFNKKDYLSLKRQEGSPELNARMEGGLRRIRKGPFADKYYGEFVMDSGVCPLLREDCLCDLQVEKGHSALPFVCRNYPRLKAYMPSGYLERALTLSCEGVLSLLWDLPDGIEFRSDPLPKEDTKWITLETEEPLPLWFAAVREWCIDILQNRRFSLPQRIWIMGLGLKLLADGETDIEHWMKQAVSLPDTVEVSEILPAGDTELSMFLSTCFRVLLSLQSTDPFLKTIRGKLWDAMKAEINLEAKQLVVPLTPYRQAQKTYEEHFGNHAYFMENVMISVFFYLHMPHMGSTEELWKSYVNFCNLYAIYRFLAVMSCREGAAGDKEELFQMMVYASRSLIHSHTRQAQLRDEFFQNDSTSLAHMAILLCG